MFVFILRLQVSMSFVTSQLRLLWNGRMIRLLFADLYAQEQLSCASNETETAGPGSPSNAEKLATNGLLPPIISHRNQSVQDSVSYAAKVRSGLTNFLRHVSNATYGQTSKLKRLSKQKIGNLMFNKLSSFPSTSSNSSSTVGPSDLPKSLKAVCMLYCFTAGSLKEIRNDILAG